MRSNEGKESGENELDSKALTEQKLAESAEKVKELEETVKKVDE